MPPVKEADPAATPDALDSAFAAAMGAPARPREAATPPEIDADAPFGRGDDGQPIAPHGYTREGKVRRSTAGRKPKDEQPRTGTGQPGTPGSEPAGSAPASTPAAAQHDYSDALHSTAQSVWFFGSALGKGGSALPLIGRFIPEQKIAAQAHLFRAHSGQLVAAVQLAAEHNARAARWAAALESGDVTWAMMVGFMTFPFVMQSAALWKDNTAKAEAHPEKIKPNNALAAMSLPSVAELAAANDAAADAFMQGMSQQFAAAMGPIDATPGPAEAAALQAELGAMNGQAAYVGAG